MTLKEEALPWNQPGWLEEAKGWIDAQLETNGISITGSIEQLRALPWSSVLLVPTNRGNIFFKASAPALRHEVALTVALAHWCPDRTVALLGADMLRGWMLMPDGGTTLREVIRADRDLQHWERLLPLYAELQIDLAVRQDAILALDVPDGRLEALPTLYESLLAHTEAMLLDGSDGLTSKQYGELQSLRPHVADLCRRIAEYGIPPSLHHGDFHDANIFFHDRRYIFFDWSDASITHPFVSLRTTLVSVEISLGLEETAVVERLRDAYLEPYTRYASRTQLNDVFDLVRRLWMIPSALAWHRAVWSVKKSQRQPYEYAVPALLGEFLGANGEEAH